MLDQSCACTWLEKDLTTGDLFFNFTDVKPGDEGENTISLHAIDNDAYVCGYVFNLANNDNGLTEPESKVDATDGAGNGELQNNLYVKIWRDTGKDVGGQPVGVACDNIYQTGEEVLVNDVPIDSNIGGWYLGQLAKSVTTCLGVAWNIPNTVGNVIQSDSVKGDIYFYVEQVRNNPSFTCPQPERIDNTLVFGPFGWAGWSCPAGMHVVGGGVAAGATVLVSQPAKPGVGTYPLYPHYNYTPPEEGWVVQNNNDNETITYYVDCL